MMSQTKKNFKRNRKKIADFFSQVVFISVPTTRATNLKILKDLNDAKGCRSRGNVTKFDRRAIQLNASTVLQLRSENFSLDSYSIFNSF